MADTLLEVYNLKKYFTLGRKEILHAVDDVSFTINRGETVGIVGESGCGKTTLGRTVLGLYRPTAGKIIFDGTEIGSASKKELHAFKKRAQIILQDPFASFNPRMTISQIISEGMEAHNLYKTKKERENSVYSLLETVGLVPEHANRFPHEFSGGQRQRIGIARALAVEPDFIVCDEPISSLDVSIREAAKALFSFSFKEARSDALPAVFLCKKLKMRFIDFSSRRLSIAVKKARILEVNSFCGSPSLEKMSFEEEASSPFSGMRRTLSESMTTLIFRLSPSFRLPETYRF